MKKVITMFLSILLIFCSISMCGCVRKSYQLAHDVSEISAIKLVIKTSGFYDTEAQGEYDELAEIKEIDAFLEEFYGIEFGRIIFGDPDFPPNGGKVILIIYNNGDLEGIYYHTQFLVRNGECIDGRMYCDKKEYEQFFDRWLENSREVTNTITQ